MINLHHFVAALKINWLKKYILKESKYLELVKTMCPMITSFRCFGAEFVKNKLNEIDNPFWKNVFESYLILNNKYCVSNWEQFKILPIWYNNYFKIGGKSFLFRDFYEKGIVLVDDLIGNNSDFHRVEYIVNTLNIRTNVLQYNDLISSIKRTLRQDNITIPTKEVETTHSQPFNRGCRKSYDNLIKNDIVSKCQIKWKTTLNLTINLNWKHI